VPECESSNPVNPRPLCRTHCPHRKNNSHRPDKTSVARKERTHIRLFSNKYSAHPQAGTDENRGAGSSEKRKPARQIGGFERKRKMKPATID
jgi:hypothetical protein